jgi:hypothetical protein
VAQIKSLYKRPAIATRKPEVDEIVALLESDKFDNATQMARKVISTAFSLMAERNWFVIASQLDGSAPIVLYGIFATESAALKALEGNTLGLFGKAMVYEVKGLNERANQLDALDDSLPLDCENCGHTEVGHNWPRSKIKGCVVRPCRCMAYVRPRRVIERVSAG